MCSHNILAHNEQGYVVSCKGCGRYQLAFGTSLATLEPADYDRFCEQVAGQVRCNRLKRGAENSKKIYLDLYCNHTMMVLSIKELKSLNSLLDEAEFNRQVGFLLQESHIKSPEN
jgi:hypothetical protein